VSAFPGLPPVDRRLFIPDEIWVSRVVPPEEWTDRQRETMPAGGTLSRQEPLSRKNRPEEWEALVASDEAIVTQLEDGTWPVSSSSAPSVMAAMIEALQLKPGMRVLEIGTGTGYNAACLAASGVDVMTVEIDQTAADQARANLQTAGFPEVEVITGNGELGYPDRAPYDRVIATAAAHTVPYPWVEQTREGGLIVTPYTGEGHRAALLVLTVNGGAATGGVAGDAAFMPLRGQRLPQAELQAIESKPGLRVEVTESGQRISTD
jgi:protein-L-isoaspartate(D-aspartate) O-methyltransferase